MRKNLKKGLILGVCMVSVLGLMACGSSKKSNDEAKKEDTKQESTDKMTGTVELTAETKEQLGETPDVKVTTTMNVDFDAMEAVIRMDADMPVGDDIMLFTIIDKKIPEDADSMQYMQCMEYGKGRVVDNGDGTYTATWNITAEDGTKADFPVTITVDGNQVSAVVEGLFPEGITVTN